MSTTPSEDVSILIIDDEFSVRDSLTKWFSEDGYRVKSAADGESGLLMLDQERYDIVLLDIKLPGLDGMEILQRIRAVGSDLVVIMITAFASVETAVQALKEGAFDYVTKPFDPDDLTRLIRSAIKQRAVLVENQRMKTGLDELARVNQIIGESASLKQVLELVAAVSRSDATVLIRGETGTGKELIARAIHTNSPRRYFPIITVNCGAVPDGLLESELFGHERGAFTGASHRRKGKIELANGGTLFLDEVGNVSSRMQMELLRVLETKRFMRLGGNREIEVDFRLVSATHSDLEAAVREGTFREDLYYRLNVFRIDVPPLRDRPADIVPLAHHFVRSFMMAMGKQVSEIAAEGLPILTGYHWPGNVRELRNVIERAVVICPGSRIEAEHLRFQFPDWGDSDHLEDREGGISTVGDESLRDVEKAHIARVLNTQEGNITRCAKILGIDRVTLYNKLKKYGIER